MWGLPPGPGPLSKVFGFHDILLSSVWFTLSKQLASLRSFAIGAGLDERTGPTSPATDDEWAFGSDGRCVAPHDQWSMFEDRENPFRLKDLNPVSFQGRSGTGAQRRADRQHGRASPPKKECRETWTRFVCNGGFLECCNVHYVMPPKTTCCSQGSLI